MTEPQFSQFNSENHSSQPSSDIWRDEVQDRLAHYKRRRGRRIEGAFTMRFPFPADDAVVSAEPTVTATAIAESPELVPSTTNQVTLQTGETQVGESTATISAEALITPSDETSSVSEDPVLEAAPAPTTDIAESVDRVVRPRPKRKVIAFPKQLSVPAEQAYRLADPVTSEAPRILDVPEELQAIPTTPFLDGLQFEAPAASPALLDHEHVDLPFRPARISKRLLAGMVDFAIVGAGVAALAAVAYKMLAQPPLAKPLILGIAAALVVLWSAYQYLFIVHSGKTVGMLVTRLRIRTFEGKWPLLRQRRHRILSFYLAALSIGMGLLWAFVDIDQLCWHDRLSRTYLSEQE